MATGFKCNFLLTANDVHYKQKLGKCLHNKKLIRFGIYIQGLICAHDYPEKARQTVATVFSLN